MKFTLIREYPGCWIYRDQTGLTWTLGFKLTKRTLRGENTGRELTTTMPEAGAQTLGRFLSAVLGG